MNIYIVLTESCEYVASYADKAKAEAFINHCNANGDNLYIRVDWLIGMAE